MIADWPSLVMETAARVNAPQVVARGEMLTRMAEADLNRRLRVAGMEATATLTTDADGEAALPADFLEARGVYVGTDRLPGVALALLRTDQLEGFAVQGTTFVSSEASTDHTLDYYAALPALGRTLATNWLLAASPDVYLAALVRQAWVAAGNVEAAMTAGAWLDGLLRDLQAADAAARLGAQTFTFVGPTP